MGQKCSWMFSITYVRNKGYPELQYLEKDQATDLMQNNVKWALFRQRTSLINRFKMNAFLPETNPVLQNSLNLKPYWKFNL